MDDKLMQAPNMKINKLGCEQTNSDLIKSNQSFQAKELDNFGYKIIICCQMLPSSML